jgi:hypothetical protein
MARSPTSRRSADCRTGQAHRSGARHIPHDDTSSTPASSDPAGDGAPVPTLTTAPDQGPQSVSAPDNPWVALAEADRQRLGRHFSRLLLLAVQSSARTLEPETSR